MNKYEEILNLPHYEFKNHKRMSRDMRAAQFAPFAALTGFYDEVEEVTKFTDKKIDISEDMKSIIDMKLRIIMENIELNPEITILYFNNDKKLYIEYTGEVKKIDLIEQVLIFVDKKKIMLVDIYDIKSDFIKI